MASEIVALARRADGCRLAESVAVAASPDPLWAVLADPRRVALALPGASVERFEADGRVVGSFRAAIGPLRLVFRGDGRVAYEDCERRGELAGRGLDRLTRSSVRGRIAFAVLPEGEGSRLEVGIEYGIEGPLAQFAQSALLGQVVARLVELVAGNLGALARGEAVRAAPEFRMRQLALPILRKLARWLVGLRR